MRRVYNSLIVEGSTKKADWELLEKNPTEFWRGVKAFLRSSDFSEIYFPETVIIPDTVEEIGYRTFCRSQNIKKVVLPKSVKIIPLLLFFGCANLTTVEIPEEVEEIERSAFKQCNSLKKINISSNLKVIEESAFENSGIEEIVFPKDSKITSIENYLDI